MKNNKRLTGILTMLVIGIWGTIAYQVNTALNQGAEAIGGQVSATNLVVKDQFAYDTGIRDPFFFHPRPSPRRSVPAGKAPAILPPALKLTGILLSGRRKRTAMLEDAQGETFILAEGDTVKGIRLVKIGSNAVVFTYQHKRFEWALPRGL